MALCFSKRGHDLDTGLGMLDRLGATPARAAVTRDLRLAGRRSYFADPDLDRGISLILPEFTVPT